MSLLALPIDPFLDEIAARLREHRAAVITAPPGAGKTTRVPPALATDGPVIVLQPRRMAARTIARRIAAERGWTIGREVGWHVRLERQFSESTRVLLATEGILTARIQQDPLLSDFRTVVLDEFHERSIHADLGIALARQAWLARDDLRIVVMSATMDTGRVAAFLDSCPVIAIAGRSHPLDIEYAPDASLRDAVQTAVSRTRGQILCFLPGAPEIRRAQSDLEHAARAAGVEVIGLHGTMPADEQDAAIADVPGRRVILATNIAETSLTVPGVTAVIDSGLHKVARYDARRGIDSLETERISRDAADQRAGRAGRIAPGVAWRLWHKADRLAPRREPDIARIDLSGPVLDILAWGGDPGTFPWFEPPPSGAVDAATELLERLEAVRASRLTELGHRMRRLPLHPRLSRILIAAGGARQAALACALLSERHTRTRASATTTSDLLSAVEQEQQLPPHVVAVARELQRNLPPSGGRLDETSFRRALLAGYPDRVAKRRGPGSPRVLLASGHGAVVGPESGVRDGTYLIALDVIAADHGEQSEARIRMASLVDAEWLNLTHTGIEHRMDDASGAVRAVERGYYGALVLIERPIAADPVESERLLAKAYLSRALPEDVQHVLRRLRFAGISADLETLAARAAAGKRTLKEINLVEALGSNVRQELERCAPERLRVPSGRTVALRYQADGSVSAEVKLQEMFGQAETPRVGGVPVLLSLLAPNGRPVQVTRDLHSFWERTYPEVRRELRGRYPRHPWPEDPWAAQPTSRTNRSGRSGV